MSKDHDIAENTTMDLMVEPFRFARKALEEWDPRSTDILKRELQPLKKAINKFEADIDYESNPYVAPDTITGYIGEWLESDTSDINPEAIKKLREAYNIICDDMEKPLPY